MSTLKALITFAIMISSGGYKDNTKYTEKSFLHSLTWKQVCH